MRNTEIIVSLLNLFRFAAEVWHIDPAGRSNEELAQAGINALSGFIKEIGLPSTLTELKDDLRPGSQDPTDHALLKKVADSTIITPGSVRQLSHDEVYEILIECI
jgi:alcohol dehydrogenase YqhD (iron-dependent ADH family)